MQAVLTQQLQNNICKHGVYFFKRQCLNSGCGDRSSIYISKIEKIILSYLAFISLNRIGCFMKESLANVLRFKLTTEFGNVG